MVLPNISPWLDFKIAMTILLATSDDEIRSCYPAMAELRPHVQPEEFLERVKRQTDIAGYRLAFVVDQDVKAVVDSVFLKIWPGVSFFTLTIWSKTDDRSKGYGGALFDWLVAHARENNCDQFHLDSGVHRFAAHRFYLTKRMSIESHHFGLKLRS